MVNSTLADSNMSGEKDGNSSKHLNIYYTGYMKIELLPCQFISAVNILAYVINFLYWLRSKIMIKDVLVWEEEEEDAHLEVTRCVPLASDTKAF